MSTQRDRRHCPISSRRSLVAEVDVFAHPECGLDLFYCRPGSHSTSHHIVVLIGDRQDPDGTQPLTEAITYENYAIQFQASNWL